MNNNEFTPPPMSYQLGGNFDPNSVDQERVVLLGLVIDRSGSTSTYEREFNEKLQEFLREEQKSHIADELFFQLTTFGSDVTIDSGWQPVVGFDTTKTLFKNSGDYTAGYDAVRISLESMLSYGKDLRRNGTDVRYNLCIVTDGEFNHGNDTDGQSVRNILNTIRADEGLYGKFTIFMYGVGSPSTFDPTRKALTIEPSGMLTTGATGKDFKAMLKSVSQSVSKSSSGTAVPNF